GYSAKGSSNATVQKMAQVNSENVCNLEVDLYPLNREPIFNQTIFSLRSYYILSRRYLTFIRKLLWKEWLALIGLYTFYSLSLTVFFDEKIALTSGCSYMEDVFDNVEFILEQKNLAENIKYNIFVCCFFLMIILAEAGLRLYMEFDLLVS